AGHHSPPAPRPGLGPGRDVPSRRPRRRHRLHGHHQNGRHELRRLRLRVLRLRPDRGLRGVHRPTGRRTRPTRHRRPRRTVALAAHPPGRTRLAGRAGELDRPGADRGDFL
ncbi:MAG: hypothetical protein AVDCRST_MAG41-3645, partial [uncultured Corynebacteriales bacterium]